MKTKVLTRLETIVTDTKQTVWEVKTLNNRKEVQNKNTPQ